MKKIIINIFLTLLFSSALIFPQVQNYNLNLVSNIEFENDANNFGVSDVWGYTDETGVEYAIVGYRFGTSIIDVSTDPNNPIEVYNVPGPSSYDYYYHRDYKTYGDYLYIVNEMFGDDTGMQVVDLSPLPYSAPIKLETYSSIEQSHNLWIDPDGLVFIEHYSGDNIQIADLSSPSEPSYLGSFGSLAPGCHDIYSANGIAYISEGNNGFGIYDISNIGSIIQLAEIIPPSSGYAHNAWLSLDGNHLVTTEETQGKTVKVWDISDFENINLKGEYLGENGLAHNVHVMGNFVYISHYTTGLKVVDIYDPQNPVEVAAFDTYPQNDNGGFYGCWGAFPFTSNNFVYASDMQNGLFILEHNQKRAGWNYGKIYDYSGQPIFNYTLRSITNLKEYNANGEDYFIGHPEGSHQFELILNDEVLEELILEFVGYETIETNIYLNDEGFIEGDINQDQLVDILDVVFLVNIILGQYSPTAFESVIANINGDLSVNVQDIILLVNIILLF